MPTWRLEIPLATREPLIDDAVLKEIGQEIAIAASALEMVERTASDPESRRKVAQARALAQEALETYRRLKRLADDYARQPLSLPSPDPLRDFGP